MTILLDVWPPGREAWKDEFAWKDIERVAFVAEDYMGSDVIYVYTSLRPESFVIPVEAKNGGDFWNELIKRGHFDADLAIKAALADRGMFVWPPSNVQVPSDFNNARPRKLTMNDIPPAKPQG